MVIFDLRGFFQAGCWGQRRRVRASHVTQLHFQVGTVRTLQGYPSPTNRFPPQSPKTTLVSQVLEGTTDNCWLANTCQPFRIKSPLLSPSASQSCLVLAGRSAAREQQFGARASERASERRVPGGGRARGSHTSGRTRPGVGAPQPPGRREDARARAGEARHPPRRRRPRRLPPRPAPRVASPPGLPGQRMRAALPGVPATLPPPTP